MCECNEMNTTGEMSYTEDEYQNMLEMFRTDDFQVLLASFGLNTSGQKSELKERTLGLLRCKPVELNYQAYLAKIVEIYDSLNINTSDNQMLFNVMQNQRQLMMSKDIQQAQPSRLYLKPPPPYPGHSIYFSRARLPQVMPQIQRGTYGNSIFGRNNIRYSYSTRPRYVASQAPLKQMAVANHYSSHDMVNENSFIPPALSLAHVTLKKLPFYKVFAEIIKPSILIGHRTCSLANFPKDVGEAEFKFTLSPEHATYIAMNCDISNGKNKFVYQLQIRICHYELGSTEITDYLPLGFHIRLNNNDCLLPPISPITQQGTEARRITIPINVTKHVKLNPSIENIITVNWIPDVKIYVLGVYLVKKLTPEKLLQKLIDKGPRSSEETKNDIIQKLANIDLDLATSSYRFSLICPLGMTRMKIPAKSTNCDHLQCFNISTFIIMNEKKPTWICPICNKPCLYDDIQIESYFWEVVSSPNIPNDCKEIEILADGSWKVYEENREPVDVIENSINLVNNDDENSIVIRNYHSPGSSNESGSMKSCIIDLTRSDDEESPEENKQELMLYNQLLQ